MDGISAVAPMKRALMGIVSIAIVWTSCPCQAQVQQATVEGTVLDSSGSVVPGADVELRDPATNYARSFVTDAAGTFRFGNLSPSVYALRISLSGFAPYEQEALRVLVGQTVHLSMTLAPASINETVRVTALPSPIDPSQTAATTVIDNERIEELPVRSRNYLDFVLLTPEATPSHAGAGSSANSGLTNSGFSFAGLRARSNLLTIDGLDNNDEFSGSGRTELSLEIVREFQVVNGGWSAENGGASGGAINVVTKSGTNTHHGDAFFFGQSGRFNPPPFLEDTGGLRPTLSRVRAGGSIGGPLVTDRSFYYVAAEREQTHGQSAADVDSPTVSLINGVIMSRALYSLSTQQATGGLFPTDLSETELSGKITHQLTRRSAVMGRLAMTDTREGADAFNTGGLTDYSARGTNATRDVASTGSLTSIIGPRLTNDLRAQLAVRRVDLSTSDQEGPHVEIPGVVDFGRSYSGNSRHRQLYAEVGDTLGFVRGRHFFKAGVDLTRVAIAGTDTDGFGGMYTFGSLNAFTSQHPSSFRQTFGDPTVDLAVWRSGSFLQDHWTPKPSLTIDLGVRFDGETFPEALHVSNRQVTPRVGIAWKLGPNWVMRGGAGVFADRIPIAAVERALVVDGHRAMEQIVDDAAATAVFVQQHGGAVSAPLAGVPPSISTVQPGDWQPSSRQAGVGIERLLTADLTASVNYLFAQGRSLTQTVNANLESPVIVTPSSAAALGIPEPTAQQLGRLVFGPARLNPAFSDIFQLQPTASSTYHGLTLSLNRRLAQEIEWSAAYTWSHAVDTASDFDEQPQNPRDLAAEHAVDQRHRLVASAIIEIPGSGDMDDPGETGAPATGWRRVFGNIEIAPILTIGSGALANPLTGVDDNRTHAWPFNARPLGAGRNSMRLPGTMTFDISVLKYVPVKPHGKLDFEVQAFNLFNRLNVTQVNPVWGSGAAPLNSFGAAIDASSARQIQFSIDLEF